MALFIGYPKNLNIGTFITAPPMPIGADTKPVIIPEIFGKNSFLHLNFTYFSLEIINRKREYKLQW